MILKEIMDSMLVSSHALDNLWGETILSACHLQNRISHKKAGKTPYELWKNYKPNLKYLKVWGCLTKVLLSGPKTRKLDSKTSDCIFNGYTEYSDAHRFLVIRNDAIDCKTIIETKNAEFFGHIFSLSNKISHASIEINREMTFNEELKRSKRPRK